MKRTATKPISHFLLKKRKEDAQSEERIHLGDKENQDSNYSRTKDIQLSNPCPSTENSSCLFLIYPSAPLPLKNHVLALI